MTGGPQRREVEVDIPRLLFIERAAVAEPVSVEMDQPGVSRPRVAGLWRGGRFYRVLKIVETRHEHGVIYLRVVTDRGCMDLRRRHQVDPRTLRSQRVWEVCADLDAVESPEHHR